MQTIQEHVAGPGGGPAPAAKPTERLRRLAEMRDSGLITAEDYEQKKDQIPREL